MARKPAVRTQNAASRAGHRIRRWGGRGAGGRGGGRPDEWGAGAEEQAPYGEQGDDWQADEGAGDSEAYDRYGGDHVDGDWRAGPSAEEEASGNDDDARTSTSEEMLDASAASEAQTVAAAPAASSSNIPPAVSNAVPTPLAAAADPPTCSGEPGACILSAWRYQNARRPLKYRLPAPLWLQQPPATANSLSAQHLAYQQRQSRPRRSRQPRLESRSVRRHPHLCLRPARIRRPKRSQYHPVRRPRLRARPQRLRHLALEQLLLLLHRLLRRPPRRP